MWYVVLKAHNSKGLCSGRRFEPVACFAFSSSKYAAMFEDIANCVNDAQLGRLYPPLKGDYIAFLSLASDARAVKDDLASSAIPDADLPWYSSDGHVMDACQEDVLAFLWLCQRTASRMADNPRRSTFDCALDVVSEVA